MEDTLNQIMVMVTTNAYASKLKSLNFKEVKRVARTACTWSLVLEVVLANGPMVTATAQGAKKNKYIPQLQSLLMA